MKSQFNIAKMPPDALPLRIESLVFDAYGTLFDVHSVGRRCGARSSSSTPGSAA
jgi:hypothetical protein